MRSECHEGLNGDQAAQISRLSNGERFVGKREKIKFVFNALFDFRPM